MNWSGERPHPRPDHPVVIGLVNNTSDRALKATEGQFLRVLGAASADGGLQLRFFTCPEIPRAEQPRALLGEPYAPIDELFDTHVDAIIVTGMEPVAARLQDEPIWPSLIKLIEWAEASGTPAAWSCLAAHAAVLYMDGINRTPVGRKLSGVFECETVSTDHPLMAGVPRRRPCPHSRYNDVPEALLIANGYQILSRSDEVGADIFVKRRGATFVFFQGHPEYDPDALMREYKRDVRRYFVGERDEYPIAPRRYFIRQTEAALARVRRQVLQTCRDTALLDEVSKLLAGATPSSTWYGPAKQIYANWLSGVMELATLSCAADRELHAHTSAQMWHDLVTPAVAFNP